MVEEDEFRSEANDSFDDRVFETDQQQVIDIING
jgi:hypothetical protein